MKKKKVLKIVLIVILSLIVLIAASAVAVFEFVIKPNTKAITEAVDQIITDESFIEEFELDSSELEGLTEFVEDELQEEADAQNEKAKKPQSEYKSTYDYVKDNVEANDFKKGVAYAARIDITYVLGLLKGGLTVPEKKELKAYLKERFTNKEINDGISLYNKYSYLLK